MIPILFDKNEISFTNNGLCRLRDCISAVVVEERNGIYELDFDYPVNGANYEQIECGRIVGVTHDEDGDLQPFEIVSVSRPIDGIVSFHAVHISYRQSQMTVSGTDINSLADAFELLKTAKPSNPFAYESDFTSTGYMASADGTPRTVRQMLGGVRGSILDAYGGEYEWDKFTVRLHRNRGEVKDFAIRYGVNLLKYDDETDYQNTFTSCVPFWKNEDTLVTAEVSSGEVGYNGNDIRIPLDLSDKFENAPTVAQLEEAGRSYMSRNSTNVPAQSISVDFVRLSELGEYDNLRELLTCKLCDSITVIFPLYGIRASFKIVRTEWDVLADRYNSMELGSLRTTLAEALGTQTEAVSSGGGGSGNVSFVRSQSVGADGQIIDLNSGATSWSTYDTLAVDEKIQAVSNKLVYGSYVYNGASTSTITFTDNNISGKSYIICGTQDAGNPPLRASINGSQITVYLGSPVTVMRVNYICF